MRSLKGISFFDLLIIIIFQKIENLYFLRVFQIEDFIWYIIYKEMIVILLSQI